MLYARHQPLFGCILAIALFGGTVTGGGSKFDICRDRVQGIKNGTETFQGITNETIGQLLYTGPVRGLRSELRSNITVITTEGMLLGPPTVDVLC
jgi:hypothetical protein